ncbi:MAG: hypothetical protein HOC71_02615, partial [Candidatus Latescibacteria bacterium]|nr:hypothetical protein [Candidatus Latescibacterota bacterium]
MKRRAFIGSTLGAGLPAALSTSCDVAPTHRAGRTDGQLVIDTLAGMTLEE